MDRYGLLVGIGVFAVPIGLIWVAAVASGQNSGGATPSHSVEHVYETHYDNGDWILVEIIDGNRIRSEVRDGILYVNGNQIGPEDMHEPDCAVVEHDIVCDYD